MHVLSVKSFGTYEANIKLEWRKCYPILALFPVVDLFPCEKGTLRCPSGRGQSGGADILDV